ncbi:MAG TPA: glycosyl hydrolase family 28-related protein, partial [Verrucomicrobiota bacterium]|nr:glycosyl hydrolase family 28-related protein [Verrucomicrobiota bacterium]
MPTKFLPAILTLAGLIAAFPARAAGDATPPGLRFVFPNDPAVLDVRRDFGAKGDGVADDTEALQRGLDASSGNPTRILFIPNGTYRLTRSLVVNATIGPWVYGETRAGVLLRLDDGITDPAVTAVLRMHPREDNPGSADWFMRNFRNFTVDAGNNPQVDGIRWFGNNSSALKHMRVRGNGPVGVNPGFLGQNGPSLVQDVTIEGFATGLRAAWNWGGTLSRTPVRHARAEAVSVNATAVGIESLKVEDAPVALRNEYPNDWTWWGGVVALVGGEFTGGSPALA